MAFSFRASLVCLVGLLWVTCADAQIQPGSGGSSGGGGVGVSTPVTVGDRMLNIPQVGFEVD